MRRRSPWSPVETLGSTSVICTDKTGTLNRDEIAVRRIATAEGDRSANSPDLGLGAVADGNRATTAERADLARS